MLVPMKVPLLTSHSSLPTSGCGVPRNLPTNGPCFSEVKDER
jgi:hypothetical protein